MRNTAHLLLLARARSLSLSLSLSLSHVKQGIPIATTLVDTIDPRLSTLYTWTTVGQLVERGPCGSLNPDKLLRELIGGN